MNARLAVATAVAAAACLAHARPAGAVLTNTCHFAGSPSVPWFDAKTTVDFWITTNTDFDPIAATGLSQSAFTNGLAQALNIWNEESGSTLKLRYRGFTSAISVSKAVVITGRSTTCLGPTAQAFPGLVNNRYDHGTIELYKLGGQCNPIAWSTTPTVGADLVQVLVHEIGHQVFNIAHPTAASGDCVNFGQISVMKAPGFRVLGNWDIEVAQGRYGLRAQFARFFRSKMTGAVTWQVPFEATGMSFLRPLFRPGSISARSINPWFGWIYAFDNGVQNGGAGRADVNRYQAGSKDWNLMTAPDGALGRPVAMAYRKAGALPSQILLAYQKVPSGSTVYNTLNGQICYRTSTNEGVTWSLETCPSGAIATTYGLTASWDSFSGAFVIAFSQHAPPTRVFEIGILAVPPAGSAGSPTVSFQGISSPHGPGIACGGSTTSSNCMVTYQRGDSTGGLGWTKVSVSSSLVATHGAVSSQGLAVFDTPSVIHVPSDNTFRMAYAVNSSAIYSYKMDALTGTSWAGTGDIFNNSAAQVSSPVLYTRDSGGVINVYGWFLKYW